MEENKKLLPQVPVLTEYSLVKDELSARLKKLNEITELTEDNRKDVKLAISEINKIKTRISRFRIDETSKFMEYINPYLDQCKELEKLCTDGLAQIKSAMTQLEDQEKNTKIETVNKLFDLSIDTCPYKDVLKFSSFFQSSMGNKTSSLTVIEKQIKEWVTQKTSDIDFITLNVDEPDAVIAIYLRNGLNLTGAIQEHQERYKNQSEIKAIMSQQEEAKPEAKTFEKKIDVSFEIKQLPFSKMKALEGFLNGLGVEWNFKKDN